MSPTDTTAITALDPLPDDPNRRRIRVGRRTVGVLPAAQVEALKLRIGMAWTPRLEQRIEHAVAAEEARRDALRLLGRSAMASERLRERLVRKGHDDAVATATVDALLEDGWLDDRAFAESVAAGLLRRGPLGIDALAARLVRRGIDRELAARVASAAVGSEGDAALEEALRWAQASLRRANRLTPVRASARISRGLAQRGVDPGTIEPVLRRLGLPTELDE